MTDAYLVGVTDHSDELERVRLLRAGADDVVTKPISTIELAARLRALLRRPRRITEGLVIGPPPTVMHYGPLQIDLGRRQAQVNGSNVALTRIEFELLAHLCQRPRDVSTRLELLRSIWGETWVGDDHVVDVHLSNLRRKLHHYSPETTSSGRFAASASDSATRCCGYPSRPPPPRRRPPTPRRHQRLRRRSTPSRPLSSSTRSTRSTSSTTWTTSRSADQALSVPGLDLPTAADQTDEQGVATVGDELETCSTVLRRRAPTSVPRPATVRPRRSPPAGHGRPGRLEQRHR